MWPISSTFPIVPFIAITILLTTTSIRGQLLPISGIIQDRLQPSASTEHLIEELLKEYSGTDYPSDHVQADTESKPNSHALNQALKGIREAIRRRFDLYISQVKEVHGLDEDGEDRQVSGRRQRRAIIKADTVLPGRRRRNITEHEDGGSQVIRVVYPLNPQPFTYQRLSDLNTLPTKGDSYSYLFALEVTDSGTYTCIYSIGKDLKPREVVRELTPGATKVEVCQIESQIYILPVEYNETSSHPIDVGSNLYRFDPSTKKLSNQQRIDTTYASAVHFWTGTGEEANDAYLAVGPEFRILSKGRTFLVEVSVYRWQGAHFDYVYSLRAWNPQAIRHARILSTGYLAIANYQDDTGSTSIYSEVFRYSHKESKYISFQKIRTEGAKSMEFFWFASGEHEDHFLAIANHCQADDRGKRNYHVKSHIFKYGLERFIPFQSFQTYGAFQFLSVKLDSKSFLVLGEISGIRMFQYNGWKFTQTYNLNFDFEAINPSLFKLRPFIHDTQPFFTIASSEAHVAGGVYALEFQQKNDYQKMAAEFEGECKKALARVQAENMTRLVEEVNAAPKVDQVEILIQSSLEFPNGGTFQNLCTKDLRYSDVVFDAHTSAQWAKREKELSDYQDEMKSLRDQLGLVILRNEDRSISTEIHFQNVDYYGEPLKASNVTVDKLNSLRLDDILLKLIHLDRNYSFDSVEIDHLVTDQHIQVERLNGDLITDFALKNTNAHQVFREENKFGASVTVESKLTVHGLFDGINLKDIDFLLKNGNQTFYGDISVRESSIGNLVSEVVNGVDLAYFLREGVGRAESVEITGAKHFQTLHVTSLESLGGISGIDVKELYLKAIMTRGKPHQTFTGRETSFESLETKAMTLGQPKLNSKWELDDFVSISSGKYELESMELLQDDTLVSRLTVNRFLNKIRVTEGELDIILKDSPKLQKIGNKFLENLHLEVDSKAYGLVDGVNLTNWSSEKRIQLNQNRLRIGTFAPTGILRIEPGIYIEKYGRFIFEGEDVTRLLQNALLLTATELPYSFRGSIFFDSLTVLGNSELRTINRLYPSDWLTETDSGETIVVRGQKTFTGPLTLLNSITAEGLYHSYTPGRYSYGGQGQEILGQLEDLLIDGRNQTIQKISIFESLLTIDRLNCPPENLILDGIPFQNLMLANGEQTVEGRVHFSNSVRVRVSMDVLGNLVTSTLNGYQLSELLKDTLKTYSSTPQIFQGGARFDAGLTVENIQTEGLVGGYNLTLLLSNIFRTDLHAQVIYGSLTFGQVAHLENGLLFSGTLNGIGHEEWGHGFLRNSDEHQLVHRPIRFLQLTVKNLTVANGKVSNYNVLRLSEELLKIDEGGHLGAVYFTGNLIADINARRVNGFNLHEDLLLTSGKNPQVITGIKSFDQGWEIDGSLEVAGLLAGIDYNQAAKFAYGKNPYTDNLRIEGNLVLKKEPFFQLTFNGEEWKDLMSRIWWTEESITINSQHSFATISLEGGATLHGLFGGIDLVQLEASYLSLSKNQHLTGDFKFDSSLSLASLSVEEIYLDNGRLNGIDLLDFRTSVFLHGVDQEIDYPIRFNKLTLVNVEVGADSLIGGMDLDVVAMRLRGDNVFEKEVTLQNLNVNRLTLGNETLINGIHLADWFNNAVSLSRPAEIYDTLEFINARFSKNIQVLGLVDGIQFSGDTILSLSGDQIVQGTTTLGGKVHLKFLSVPNGTINGYDLKSLIETLILKDRGTGSILVYGEKTFTHLLETDSIEAESLFQGHNLNETIGNLKPAALLPHYFNESLEERYKAMGALALDLHQVADRRLVVLDYFDLVLSYNYNPDEAKINVFKVMEYQETERIFISTWSTKESLNILSWGSYSSNFQLSHNITFKGILRDFVTITRENQVYLIVSLSSHGPSHPAEALLEYKLIEELEKSSTKYGRTIILKLDSDDTWLVHQVIHGHDFGHLATLELILRDGAVSSCAVTITSDGEGISGRALVLCFNPVNNVFSTKNENEGMEIYATLPVVLSRPSANIMGTLTILEKTFLVIGNGGYGSEVVDVWVHDRSGAQFIKESCIPAPYLTSLDLTENAVGQVFLALGTRVLADENQETGRVYIYRYSEEKQKFEKIQSIRIGKVSGVSFQSLGPISTTKLLYIAAERSLYVYAYKGLGGFILEHVLPTAPALSLETTSHVTDGVFRADALVLSSTEIQVFRAQLAGLLGYAEDKGIVED